MNSKLDAPKVQQIRRLIAGKQLKHQEIASRFGVSRVTVKFIAENRAWSSLPLPKGITQEMLTTTRAKGAAPRSRVVNVTPQTVAALTNLAKVSAQNVDDVIREALYAWVCQRNGKKVLA